MKKNLTDQRIIVGYITPEGAIEVIKHQLLDVFKEPIANEKEFTVEDIEKVIEMAREGNFSHVDYFGYPDWTLTSDQIIDTIKNYKSEKST